MDLILVFSTSKMAAPDFLLHLAVTCDLADVANSRRADHLVVPVQAQLQIIVVLEGEQWVARFGIHKSAQSHFNA